MSRSWGRSRIQFGATSSIEPVAIAPYLGPSVAILLIIAALGPNVVEILISIAVLCLGTMMLWRRLEAPILLFVFLHQWLESSILCFYANIHDQKINSISFFGGDLSTAMILSLLGTLFFSAGIRISVGPPRHRIRQILRVQSEKTSTDLWFWIYVSLFITATAAQLIASQVPSISQPLLALASIKWAGFVMFTYATFVALQGREKRPRYGMGRWILVLLIELSLSIGGFFSLFKFVFAFAFIGIATASQRITKSRLLWLSSLMILALLFGLVWTAIKSEYRFYASEGQTTQEVSVNWPERMTKLIDLSLTLTTDQFGDASRKLIQRFSYTEFFGSVLRTVPDQIPYQNGALWFDAISRPFMPRLFFPEKSAIDESKLTNTYTKLGIAGWEQGTQISIGYIGEAYIDFGRIGMMAVLLILGLWCGLIYRWLAYGKSTAGIFGMGLSSSVLMLPYSIGISSTKLVGGLAVAVLVSWLLANMIVPEILRRFSTDFDAS